MDLDRTLLDLVLTQGRLEPVIDAGLTLEDFEGQYKLMFSYVIEYWRNPRYKGAVPSPQMIQRKFPEYEPPKKGKSKDNLEAVMDEIRRRSLYNLMKSGVEKVAQAMKKNDVEGASKLWHQYQSAVLQRQSYANVIDLTKTTDQRWKDFVKRRDDKGGTGVPTGFNWTDNVLGGWQPEDFVLMIAKTGVGKTWWALICAIAAQLHGIRVLVVSREMSNKKLALRYDSLIARLSYKTFKQGKLGKLGEKHYREQLERIKKLQSLFLYEHDFTKNALCTPGAVHARARELKCQMVVIDGVYMMDSDSGVSSGWEMHFDIGRGLKGMCKADGMIVLATNQMNSEDDPKEATLDNCAYGKAYGQFADIGMKMFRGKDEILAKEMKEQFLKTREEECPQRPQTINWDFEEMQFHSLDDDDGGSDAPEPATPAPTDMKF